MVHWTGEVISQMVDRARLGLRLVGTMSKLPAPSDRHTIDFKFVPPQFGYTIGGDEAEKQGGNVLLENIAGLEFKSFGTGNTIFDIPCVLGSDESECDSHESKLEVGMLMKLNLADLLPKSVQISGSMTLPLPLGSSFLSIPQRPFGRLAFSAASPWAPWNWKTWASHPPTLA